MTRIKLVVLIAVAVGTGAAIDRTWPTKPEPTWQICFQFNLNINESISSETATVIAKELREAADKIGEACASARERRWPV